MLPVMTPNISLPLAQWRRFFAESVVDAAHGYKTVQSLPTTKGARTMAYDEDTDRVYLVTAEFGPRPEPTTATQGPGPPPCRTASPSSSSGFP